MRRLLRWWVARYIRNHMGHEHRAERNAFLRAIGEGVQQTFTEDNFNTRLNFVILELTKNTPEALDGYRVMGKRIYHDSVSAANSARSAVMEAMADVPVPYWRQEMDKLDGIVLKNNP